jgi:hypothetical protein
VYEAEGVTAKRRVRLAETMRGACGTGEIRILVAQPRAAYDGRHREWVRSIMEKEAAAAKAWRAGGGWRGEKKRREETAKAEVRRETLRLGARFAAFVRQGRAGRIGMSGAELERVTGAFELEIEARRMERGPRGGGGGGKRKKRVTLFDVGAAPDRWGRWRVATVMEVRRLRTGARGRMARGTEARIRWAGRNPETGMPWKDEWSVMEDEGGWVGNAAFREEVREMEDEKYGLRESRGRRPKEKEGEEAEKMGKERRGKRHRTRGWYEEERSERKVATRRRIDSRIVEDGELRNTEEEALKDARLRRAGRKDRKRRWVVEDESSGDDSAHGE